MYVQQYGNPAADTVLFLHAVGQSGGMWDRHIEELSASGYYCVAPDLPGHGRSRRERWTDLDDVTRQVVELVDLPNRGKIHIVGLSLGGSIAIKLLNNHPDIVQSAVIDGASAGRVRFHRLMIAGVSLLSPFVGKAPIISLVASMLGVSPDGRAKFERDMKAVSPHAFRAAFSQANRIDTPAGMGKVTARVLFVAGEKEPAELRQWQCAQSQIMHNARAYIAPGQVHGGLLARNPYLHVHMVRSWIESTPLPAVLVPNSANTAQRSIALPGGARKTGAQQG